MVKVDTGGLKKYSKRAVGRWCLVAIDGANTMLLKLSKSTQKCTNRGAERERAQGSATTHSALLPLRLKWKAVIKEEHHNHGPSPEPTSHPSHRRAGIANLSESSKQMVDRPPKTYTVRAQLGDMGVKVTSKDLYNMKQRARDAQLGGLIAVRYASRAEVVLSIRTTADIQLACCKRVCWWGMFSSNANSLVAWLALHFFSLSPHYQEFH